MTRILFTAALACVAGPIGLSAQMKHVDIKDAKGTVIGMVMISPVKGGGVSIDLDVRNLPPGEHAIHFHAVPKCEPPFASAGGHFNPTNTPHGTHAGDMGNFKADAKGNETEVALDDWIEIGAFAKPDDIRFTDSLPKTRSGKIMRRILRKIASSEYTGLGDVTTLAEPEVVDKLIEQHRDKGM